MSDLTELNRAADEHKAWMIVVDNFRHAVGDINAPEYDGTVKAIQAWGELLVDLRVNQSEAVREIARQQALFAYLNGS